MPIKSIVKLENIEMIYDQGTETETRAIKNVSLEIEEGEYVSFFGGSGCGKTTLIYIIAGIQKNTGGTVLVNNFNLSTLSSSDISHFRQSTIGVIFQHFNLIPTLTIFDNIALPLIFTGMSLRERTIRVQELLKQFDLVTFERWYPHQLSGGQQQRVAIARAIANDPPIILADEPIGNLDVANAMITLDYLKKLNEENKKTIILVTHELWTLRDVQKIFFMRDGALEKTELRKDLEETAIPSPTSLTHRIDPITPPIELPQSPTHILCPTEPLPPLSQKPTPSLLSEKKSEPSVQNVHSLPLEKPSEQIVSPKPYLSTSEEKGVVIPEKSAPPSPLLLFSFLHPTLTRDELRVRFCARTLLRDYPSAQQERFAEILLQYKTYRIGYDEFVLRLDTPFHKGGVGLWKRSAEKIAEKIRTLFSSWHTIDEVLLTLSHAPSILLIDDARHIREMFFASRFTPPQQERIERLLEEKMRGNSTWDHFEHMLSLPLREAGAGLQGSTPSKMVQLLKVVFAETTIS